MNTRFHLSGSPLFLTSMLTLCGVIFLSGCTTTKKKDDLSGMGMLYQNMTAHYNGYFNATEIMKESVATLETEHQDNYNQILPVFEYTAVGDPKSVSGELDEAIKKSSVVISLHRPSKWTDDCYLLIGQAQYLKQDFESAQKTLEYMVNNFDDTGKSTAKASKKPSKAQSKAERARKIQEKNKEIQARKKEQAKNRAERNKEIKSKKKEQAKSRKADKRAREKANKKRKKEREKANKARKKNRKKAHKKKKPVKRSTPTKSDTKPDDSKANETKEVDKKTSTPTTKTQPAKSDKKEEFGDDIKEESKKKDEKKKEKEEKTKDGALAHKPAKPHGMLWLAKTYVERDFLLQADRLFKQAAEASGEDKKLQEELYPSMAHFYIYTEQYNEAIPALEKSIEATKRKALKARYAYIIGQLQMMGGNNSAAVSYFDQAAGWSRDYEMEFNARMNSKLASMSSGSKSGETIARELEKMLKEDKNADYKDQIYFQIAKVYLEANNDKKAEEYLKLALEQASKNPAQKTEIHYALGEIYFEKDKFDLAYDNYSLALTSMGKTDKRYRSLEERTTQLKDIAGYVKELNLQDSLLMLASLSEEELKDRAEKILKDKAEKQAAAEEKMRELTGKNSMPSTIATSTPVATSNSLESKFFAYNDRELKKGEREFARTWGSRPLVDDWRRKESGESSTQTITDDIDVSISNNVTSKEVEDIFKDLPRTDEARFQANQKIGDALYNLGMAYRNNLERLDLSTQAFARFVNKNESDARLPEAYYFLYLNARDQGDMTTANQYAALLKEKYPDSKYALIAADPSYIDELLNDQNSVEAYYESIYAAFNNGDYKRVYDAFDQAKSNFGSDDLYLSKFALLKAMSVGKLSGKEQYIEALRTVVAQYPNTAEQIRAREIIRFLGGDEEAFNKSWNDQLIVTSYKVQNDKLHYVVVVLYNDDVVKIDEAKIAINNYNNLFHKLKKYSIRSFIVNREEKTPAILIRKFEDKSEAMTYYNEVNGRMKDFLPEEADAEVYAISQHNYREMIKSGGVSSYKQFFEDNYLRE